MVEGYINAGKRPLIEVTVLGSQAEASVLAILDTGFDGDISLPLEIAVGLGLTLDSAIKMELADGSVKLELVFTGKVLWENKSRNVDILITTSEDALIGTGLLDEHSVHLDFRNNQVKID